MENDVTAEARRAERSEAILRAEGVPINRWLSVIETEEEAKLRTKNEVCYRALSLIVVAELRRSGMCIAPSPPHHTAPP